MNFIILNFHFNMVYFQSRIRRNLGVLFVLLTEYDTENNPTSRLNCQASESSTTIREYKADRMVPKKQV